MTSSTPTACPPSPDPAPDAAVGLVFLEPAQSAVTMPPATLVRCLLVLALAASFASEAGAACDFSASQVQLEALRFLRNTYPDQPFVADSNADKIRSGPAEFGLQNLRSKLCLALPKADAVARDAIMREHFAAVMRQLEKRETVAPTSWSEAQALLIPQFMPTDYLHASTGRLLVTRPFVPGVELGIALDRREGYGYVRDEDRARWKVDAATLFDLALKNLDRKSQGAKLQGGGDPDRFLAVEEKDGHDATRILVPWIRQEAAKYLGDPFFVMIPNRDFLIMWGERDSARFQAFARSKGRAGFDAQPYPLSGQTLRVWASGKIEITP